MSDDDDDMPVYVSQICEWCDEPLNFNQPSCICGCINSNYEIANVQYSTKKVNLYTGVIHFKKYISNTLGPISNDLVKVMIEMYQLVADYYLSPSKQHNRKNMPVIAYLSYKICQKLGLVYQLAKIKLPKRETLCQLDKDYRGCCEYYGWQYTPTIRSTSRTYTILKGGEIIDIKL